MQIKNIKISNIWSFWYISNINQNEWIMFQTQKSWIINILIWPNWSGKSTILEVINQIFKKWICQDYAISENSEWVKIKLINHKFQNLSKNLNYKDKTSSVYLQFEINDEDKKNMIYIQKNIDKINKIISTYYDKKLQFEHIEQNKILSENEFGIFCTINFQNSKIVVRERNMNPIRKFILEYIRHFELIQICINIWNNQNNENNEKFETLKNTFAIVGANRIFDENILDLIANDEELDNQLINLNTKKVFESALGYILCLKKCDEISLWSIDILTKKTFFINLNKTLQKYLKLEIKPNQSQSNIFFEILNSEKQTIWIDELSSGEQSLFSIIMTIFGYDLENWTLIIDEPELHLHPQAENKIINFLDRASKKFKIQIIIATHSPTMINTNTISQTIRIYKYQNQTKIYNRKQEIQKDESELLQMLKYGNIAKMFFCEKIIMVEWETDMYFWNWYLEYLKNNWKNELSDYEIINIWWKWFYLKRKWLLDKFGICSYYIWDWDNILDGMWSQITEYKNFLKQNKKNISDKYKIIYNTQGYEKLIQYIIDNDVDLYNQLNQKIKEAQKQDIFILSKWDLETYLGLRSKWLDVTIRFCHDFFDKWISNISYKEYIKEIDNIVDKIFS